MANVTQTIHSLTQGISQQPDEQKIPGQVRSMVNAVPDLVQGLLKRPEGKFVDVTRLSDGMLRPEKSLFIPLIVQQSGLIIHDSDDKVILTQVMDKSIVVMKDKDDGKILLVNDNFIDAYKTILITMRIDLGQRLRDGILHNFQVGQFSNFREVA